MEAPHRDEAPSRLLERMRLRLLDLSARNPLLNYTHPRASSLRIVDEVPAVVLDALVGGRAFRFAPLRAANAPAPVGDPPPRAFARRSRNGGNRGNGASVEAADASAEAVSERERREAARAARAQREEKLRELAVELGIDPSYDLRATPASEEARRSDWRLQTLLTPDELEARLQKMQASAVTAIQESGANMLHLLFGFVEWSDVPGEKTRLSPLVLLPANLSRLTLDSSTHTYPYTVAASGEDWSTNVTLQEMCRKSFGFVLPSVEAEEDLETYFARVEEVLRVAAPGWTLRRQLTLGLVSFGKILMWRDLDPATWPEGHPLLTVPLLRQVLGGDEPESDDAAHDEMGAPRTAEYNIDALPAELRKAPPIIVPADSSQHSVLIDVQRGESLVVQGPPGTGKSQTITNLIADAIAAGKKVLFVAEKKAALDVVARRLDDAGLGPFCLPLHSHTSNKREFLDALKARIDLHVADGGASVELTATESLLVEARKDLSGHVDRLHRTYGSLGLTAFDILWRARRLSGEMPEGVVAALRGTGIPNARMVTDSEVAKHRATLQAFAAAHAAVAADIDAGATHPWHGMSRADLTFDDAEALVTLARRAREALKGAEAARQALVSAVGTVTWPDSPEGLTPLLARVRSIAAPDAHVPSAMIEAVHSRAGESATRAAVAAADAARSAWTHVEGPWAERGALDPDDAKDFATRLSDAGRMLGESARISTLKDAIGLLSEVVEHLATVQTMATTLAAKLGVTQPLSVGLALALIDVATSVSRLPEDALSLRGSALQAPDAGERLAALAERSAELVRTRALLDARFIPEMRPSIAELRRIAGAFAAAPRFMPGLTSGDYRRAVAQYRRMSSGRRADRATMLADVESMIRYQTANDAFIAESSLRAFFGPMVRPHDSPFAAAIAVFEWARRATALFRGGGEAGRALSDAIWMAWTPAWLEVSELALTNAEARHAASVLAEDLTAAAKFHPGDIVLWEGLSFDSVEDQLHRWRDIAIRALRVGTSAKAADNVTIASLSSRLDALQRAWSSDAAVESHAEAFRVLDIALPAHGASERGDTLQAVRGALAYLTQFHERGLPRALVEWLASGEQKARVTTLLQHVATVSRAIETGETRELAFVVAAGVDARTWYGEWPKGAAFALRVARFERAIDGAGTLARYAARLRARAKVIASPIPAACELLESGTVPGEQLPVVYDYLLARSLAEAVLRERPELDQFTGSVHETRRAQFAMLDERYITLTRQVIARRANAVPPVRGVGYGPVSDLSEQSLIEHEIEKTRRHIPIREMFRRAGRAIQALKPCFMMGPQAVAQYLPPGLFHFDLVVMDEASQMRPEDALGAVARGAQLVVVGDPKQLGPTTFFDVVASDEEEIEELAAALAAEAAQQEAPPSASVLERSESILQAAARRYPLRMLRWHYRSRYPELIAFSNREFYGNGLVLFPHSGAEREGDGVNLRTVSDAVYGSSLNPREAEALVEAVRKHATQSPERTLMVVTMNQPQRELVDTLVQNAEKDDAALAAFRERHQESLEPFAVKNLENVQGDERDVVLVGVTYGPDESGKLVQNFGPINAMGGERRLNVLFTRAKFRLHVFCSFDPSMLRVSETSSRGLCVLRDYLRFAGEKTLATGRPATREPQSDFEIEVSRALRAHGYEVHPQVGVAGYHLDLAVVDPNHPRRYLLGIECDGAMYHSARSARDRDRLRQEVLQMLGWQIHRIWSIDWFRDPRGETVRLVRRIRELGGVEARESGPPEVRRSAGPVVSTPEVRESRSPVVRNDLGTPKLPEVVPDNRTPG